MIINKKAISNSHLFIHQAPRRKNKWNGEVSILIQDETESTSNRLPDELQYDLDKNYKIGMEND